MKDIISKAVISANMTKDVYKQVLNELVNKDYFIAYNESDVFNFFVGVYKRNISDNDICAREVQRLELDGEPQDHGVYTYIPTITVKIYENYVDSGSMEYVYTVKVTEE